MLNSRSYESDAVIEAIEAVGLDPARVRNVLDPQSMCFMADILPFLRTLYPGSKQTRTLLDVGSRTAAGVALLATILNPKSNAKLKIKPTALDIDARYRTIAKSLYPDLEYIVGDIGDIKDRKWDIVTCSHTLEHIPNPKRFLGMLKALANEFVVISTPYKEDPGNLIPGHVNSFDEAFVTELGTEHHMTYNGFYWHQSDILLFAV